MDIRSLLDAALLDDTFPLPLDRPFTLADGVDAGLSPHNLGHLVRAGLLRRPVRGVYVPAQAVDDLPMRCDVLRRVVPPDAVVCDRHAGWLHGADMVLAPGEHLEVRPVSVYLPPGRRLRNAVVDSGERRLGPDDVVEIGGLRVTSPLRTALDLGRVRSRDAAMSGLDAMLRLGVDRDQVLASTGRFKGMRWVTTLRLVAPDADARSASPGESALKNRMIDALGRRPDLQVEVRRAGRLLGILDLAVPELRYGAEYDGEEWHGTAEQRDHDRLRRESIGTEGWQVDVFTKREVYRRPAEAVRRIQRGVHEARRRLSGPLAS